MSPFLPELRGIGHELLEPGIIVPLVVENADDGAFRVSVALWAGVDGVEVVERAERLEALVGMWDGRAISTAQWQEAHKVARRAAEGAVAAMRDRAAAEEHAALERQVDAAGRRLRRELARFLACAAEDGEVFNTAFHRWMQRGGQTAALLSRAHALVGYPDWSATSLREARESVQHLTANQRKNVLLGTPLESAIRDPRWAARTAVELSV